MEEKVVNEVALSALIGRINDDAAAEAEKIIGEANSYAAACDEQAANQADEYKAEQLAICDEAIKTIVAGYKTLSAIESKKTYLAAKQAIAESVFSRAIEMLCALSEEKYLALISSLVEKYAEDGDEIVLSSSCTLTEKSVSALKAVSSRNLKVSKSGQFAGGIVLSGKKFDKDLTFEALVAALKEQTEEEVAKKLFG